MGTCTALALAVCDEVTQGRGVHGIVGTGLSLDGMLKPLG